jgi:hypothetical protein
MYGLCEDCRHWSGIPLSGERSYGKCAVNAFDVDVLTGALCSCADAGDAFEPSEAYAEELAEVQNAFDECAFNGVKPGVDFPASLAGRP